MRLGYGVPALCPLCVYLSFQQVTNTREAASVSPTSKPSTYPNASKETDKSFFNSPSALNTMFHQENPIYSG